MKQFTAFTIAFTESSCAGSFWCRGGNVGIGAIGVWALGHGPKGTCNVADSLGVPQGIVTNVTGITDVTESNKNLNKSNYHRNRLNQIGSNFKYSKKKITWNQLEIFEAETQRLPAQCEQERYQSALRWGGTYAAYGNSPWNKPCLFNVGRKGCPILSHSTGQTHHVPHSSGNKLI